MKPLHELTKTEYENYTENRAKIQQLRAALVLTNQLLK